MQGVCGSNQAADHVSAHRLQLSSVTFFTVLCTHRFSTGLFKRFRNPKDKRDFVTAGVSVGVATAFNAPIGKGHVLVRSFACLGCLCCKGVSIPGFVDVT